MPSMKKLIGIGAACAVVGFIGLQVFPAKKIGVPTEDIGTNPPERFDIGAPPEVATIMRKACFDCHTNETKWPLYARLAPGSWLMARDVHNGRNHLNLSHWADSDEEERQSDKENCWEQIESGAMPPWFYIYPLHPGAKLSAAEKATLKDWLMKDAGKKKEEAVAAEEDEAKGGDPKSDKGEKKGDDKVVPKADAAKATGEPAVKSGSGATGKPARLTTNAKKQAKK
jgi:hypothetical protein